jgi:hypothetical protein
MGKSIAIIALLMLPAAAAAQRGRGQRMRPDSAMQQNVIEIVVQHKADLALTSDQIAKLEPIAKSLDEKNKNLVEELARFRGTGTRPTDMSEEQRQQMRSLMEKVREHRTNAVEELRAVLNEEQMKKVRELLPQGRGGRRGR